jgi:ketosteroid isomerase-like protein
MVTDTETVARRFLEAWNAGGESILDELAAPDLVVSYSHFPEPLRGAEAFKQALRQTHEYFPDLQITAEEVITAGDTVVVRWS